MYNIEIDKFFFKMILALKGNFTKIDLAYQKKWKSSNTVRLYQYLKSIQAMEYNITHDIGWFNDYFAPKTDLKYLSECIKILDRNIKIINKDTDIKVELVVKKSDKTFTFFIKNKKALVKNTITNIAKRF